MEGILTFVAGLVITLIATATGTFVVGPVVSFRAMGQSPITVLGSAILFSALIAIAFTAGGALSIFCLFFAGVMFGVLLRGALN